MPEGDFRDLPSMLNLLFQPAHIVDLQFPHIRLTNLETHKSAHIALSADRANQTNRSHQTIKHILNMISAINISVARWATVATSLE